MDFEPTETPNIEPKALNIGLNERSILINELATALSKAQGEMESAKKDSNNPFFKSSYADLASCIKAAKEPLTKNDLSIVQLVVPNEKVQVTTMLMHKSGQYITSTICLTPVKSDPQSLGSAITYARRYAYQAILGLSAEDDDGNKASQTGNSVQNFKPSSDAQIERIEALLDPKGQTEESILNFYKVKNLKELSTFQASAVITRLESMDDVDLPDEAL